MRNHPQNRLRDQAGNPIFNVVSRHTRTGFGLIFDQSGILKISLQILSPATVPDAVTSDLIPDPTVYVQVLTQNTHYA